MPESMALRPIARYTAPESSFKKLSRRAMALPTVLLPEPEGPSMAITSLFIDVLCSRPAAAATTSLPNDLTNSSQSHFAVIPGNVFVRDYSDPACAHCAHKHASLFQLRGKLLKRLTGFRDVENQNISLHSFGINVDPPNLDETLSQELGVCMVFFKPRGHPLQGHEPRRREHAHLSHSPSKHSSNRNSSIDKFA